jgi:hypothetical protein
MQARWIAITALGLGAVALIARLEFAPSADKSPDGLVRDDRGVIVGGLDPNPQGGPPLNIDNIVASADAAVIVSRDGRDTFTVPTPEDPEWSDYLEFRRTHRTSLDNSPGYAVPYDPEWRAADRGFRKDVPEPFLQFYGGSKSLGDVVHEVVKYLNYDDPEALVDLAVRKEEFSDILWPSMPQARPYVRIPWEEAWGFQYANILGGIRAGQRQRDDRQLAVESFQYGKKKELPCYTLFSDLVIQTRDQKTGEPVKLTFLDSVVEYDGVFKVFAYRD